MNARNAGSVAPDRQEQKKEPAVIQGEDSACRCKETSEMSPRELLRRMMKDLAFWKKEEKD